MSSKPTKGSGKTINVRVMESVKELTTSSLSVNGLTTENTGMELLTSKTDRKKKEDTKTICWSAALEGEE